MKIVTVFGATGSQGLGVVNELLKTGSWHVRAVTRNAGSATAKELAKKGCEVVIADFENTASLQAAVKGAHAVYGVTDYWRYIPEHGPFGVADIETRLGIALATVLAEQPSLEHFIWSTLPPTEHLGQPELVIPHWNCKALVDKYIKERLPELAKKTTFLRVAFYADNLAKFAQITPVPYGESGKRLLIQPCSATTPIPMTGSVSHNTGKYVRAILEHPEVSLPAKYSVVFETSMTFPQMLDLWQKVTGKQAVYMECSEDEYARLWDRHFSAEVTMQYDYMGKFPDAMFDQPDIVEKEILGVEGLVTVEETFQRLLASWT